MISDSSPRWRRSVTGGVALILPATLAGAAPALAQPPATGPLTTVIVQFDAEPVVSVAATGGVVDAQADARIRQARQAVARTENAVLEAAEAAGIEVEHRRSYDVLLPGMSVNVPTDQVDDLRRLPGVAAVHENRTFRASTVDSVPLIGAPEVC